MREAVAPQRPITHQPLTACRGLSCSMYCVRLTVYGQLCVRSVLVNAWDHIWWGSGHLFSHDDVYHSQGSERHSNMHDSFVWMVDIWGFMDMQKRIHNHIASLNLCQRYPAWVQEGLPVPSGLVQGSTPHWIRPLAVSPSLLSMGLTDRLNDTVEVAACLQLIFECDWSTQWVAFHQCWADKRDVFIVVPGCVFTSVVYSSTPAIWKRYTREESLYGHY